MPQAYTATQTPAAFVDWEGLQNLINQCLQPGKRVALVGFNEHSKHLLNLCRESIVAVYDSEDWKIGISYAGLKVSPPTEKHDINQILVCSFALAYEFTGVIRRLYDNKVPWYCPPRIDYKPSVFMNVFEQEGVYQTVAKDSDYNGAIPTMMGPQKIQFLMELLRVGLRAPGNVIEMGVWQGGSAWHLAKVLNYFCEERTVYLVDLFERHMADPTATMCKDQINRQLSFYPHCKLFEGLVDDPNILSEIEGPFCFAHFDLGFIPKAIEFIWERLQPGCPLVLDNYGHLVVSPWDFDDYFSARGTHVIRIPWSEQGVVFKPCK